jgi:hypothetical protein
MDKLINGEPIDAKIPYTVIDVLSGRGDADDGQA